MLRPTTVTLSEDTLKEIDKHPLSRSLSRSAITRIAINDFLLKTESANKNKNISEEKSEDAKFEE